MASCEFAIPAVDPTSVYGLDLCFSANVLHECLGFVSC